MEPNTETPPAPSAAGDESKALEKTKTITPVVYDPNDVVGLYMNTGVFAQLQRVATLMASANLAPAHLRGNDKIADCFLVVAQAFRWGMDPFAVAQHTFVLSGKLGYEGKLIAAVINTHPKIERKLDYTYEGEGENRKVTVSARVKGEDKDRIISGTIKLWATQNEKWRQMPDQMLAYRGAREWARRHMPEAVLGIQAEDEIAAGPIIDTPVAPAPRSLDALTERIETTTPPISSSAPAPPPATAAPASKSSPASVGQVLAPEREPGSDDDDPAPIDAVKGFAQKAATQPGKGRPQQSRITE